MSLTLTHAPLSEHPAEANYRIDGPAHRLFFEDFPRRVRAVFAGETILDTRAGKLLYETGLLPQLYVPRRDVRLDLLEPHDRETTCPYKGRASYWSVEVGDRAARAAVWSYAKPKSPASWLEEYLAFDWRSMDAWFDENEAVEGHLRDPYHRVDARVSNRHVRVSVDGRIIAETERPVVLSETGLPNRYYVPPQDVERDALELSATHTVCPYKGTASYRTIRAGGRTIKDGVWLYPEPMPEASRIAGCYCFDVTKGLTVEVDGERLTG